jgi:hypothetical protein
MSLQVYASFGAVLIHNLLAVTYLFERDPVILEPDFHLTRSYYGHDFESV